MTFTVAAFLPVDTDWTMDTLSFAIVPATATFTVVG